MAWTKKCTETTFAGWKQQMNILTIGDIPDKGGWKIYGMELPDTVLEKVYPRMRSGSSISSEAEHRNERQANETALLSDYKLRSLAETHRCRHGNDVAARRLHPDSDEAGSTSLRTLQDLGRGNTRRSGRANQQHR